MPQFELPFMEKLWREKISNSIELIRLTAKSGPVCVYHSGGKDSVCIAELAKMAGIPHRKIYHVTTVDPPELVRFVRTCGVEMSHPGKNFFKMVEQKGLPTRWRRWCCDVFKHGRTEPGVSILGVRADESPARKATWKPITNTKQGWNVCPILTWSTTDVWRFIRERRLNYCSLYDAGFKRIGCIGCPLAGCPHKELDLYPRIKETLKRAWWKYSETHKVDDVQRAWDGWIECGKLYGEAAPPDEDDCQMQYLFV